MPSYQMHSYRKLSQLTNLLHFPSMLFVNFKNVGAKQLFMVRVRPILLGLGFKWRVRVRLILLGLGFKWGIRVRVRLTQLGLGFK